MEEERRHVVGVMNVEECEDLTGTVHLLPCCITHNGPAPVSQFFVPKPFGKTEEGCDVKEATLRGRKLLGCTLEIPTDYWGLVLKRCPTKESKRSMEDGEEKRCDQWKTEAAFHDLTYWNHESMPTAMDPVRRNFEWLNLAPIIHESISAEDVEAMAQELSDGTASAKRKFAPSSR